MKLPLAAVSGSYLPRIAQCAASAVLPQNGSTSIFAERGTALHAFLEGFTRYTQAGNTPGEARALALAEVDEQYRDACASIDLDELPVGLHFEPEPQFAWNVEKGTAQRSPTTIDRTIEIPCRGDSLAISCDDAHDWRIGYLFDFKTGRRTVKAFANWQMRLLAMCMMSAHGCDRVEATLVYIDPETGEVTYRDRAVFTTLDADAFADELREKVIGRVVEAANMIEKGLEPRVNSGEHCKYCPAFVACPEKKALLLRLAGGGKNLERELPTIELTVDSARRALFRIWEIELVLKKAKEAVYGFASQTPIPLDNGRVLGARQKIGPRKIDGFVAHAAIEELHDERLADACVTMHTTQAAIKRMLQPHLRALDAKFAPAMRAIMAKVEEQGGISRNVGTVIDVHDIDALSAPEDEA